MKLLIFLLVFFHFIQCYQENEVSVLRVGIPSDLGSLDPLFATDLISRKFNSLYFRKLFRKSKIGKVEKDLASEFAWKNGRLVVKIQDQFLQVEDIIYSLNRAKKEEHPFRYLFDPITEIRKISPNEVSISCKCKLEEILDILSNPASSIFKQGSDKEFFSSRKDLSILEWKRGNDILLEYSHPDYKKVHFQVVSNSFTGIYLFSKRKLGIFKVPYFFYNHPVLKSGKFFSREGNSIQYIAINHKNSCLDRKFRLALNLAVDRKKIIEKIFFNLAQTTYLSFPKKYVYLSLQKESYIFEYSPTKAKSLLEKSICYEKLKNKVLDFRLRADDENKAKGLALTHYFEEIGLKVKLHFMEKAPLYKENSEGKGDLTLLTWYADYESALNFIDPLLASDKFGNSGNRSFYTNPKLDTLIQESRINFTLSEQAQKQVLEILKEDVPLVFLWSLNENYLVQEDWKIDEISKFLF